MSCSEQKKSEKQMGEINSIINSAWEGNAPCPVKVKGNIQFRSGATTFYRVMWAIVLWKGFVGLTSFVTDNSIVWNIYEIFQIKYKFFF